MAVALIAIAVLLLLVLVVGRAVAVLLLTIAILLLHLTIAILLLLLLAIAILLMSLLTVAILLLLLLPIAILLLLLLTVSVLLLLLTIAILLLLLTVAVQLARTLAVLVALVAIILNSLVAILVLTVLLLGQIAHEHLAVVGLVGGPSGLTVRHHTVATNVTILDTFLHVVVVFGELDEGILLVLFVRHGRNWMRVWDVVTTEVITTVHGVLHVLWKMRFSSVFVQWLPDCTFGIIVIHLQFLERGPLGIHGLGHSLASAVGSNNEVFLHFVTDNGPLGGAHWSFMATEIVIDEELAAVTTCLTLGEEGVRKEYRWQLLIISGNNGLHHVHSAVVRLDLWHLGKYRVLNGSPRISYGFREEFITLNVLSFFKRSFLALVSWTGEIGEITLVIAIGVRGLSVWIVMVIPLFFLFIRATECSVLHDGTKSLSTQGGRACG